MAVAAAGRRADRDEHGLGLAPPAFADSVVKVRRPARTFCDQFRQARLVDRHLAALERRDLVQRPCRRR